MAFPNRAPVVLSWLWPQVFVVTFQYSAKHFQQCFNMQWSVQHGKGAVPEGVGQAPNTFAFRGLTWSDDDRGELREGYDAMSMSMSRSANLEEERGERGQSAGNERLRAVRFRERAAARLRRRVRRVA